jgi:hypothetical protein
MAFSLSNGYSLLTESQNCDFDLRNIMPRSKCIILYCLVKKTDATSHVFLNDATDAGLTAKIYLPDM